MAKRSKKDPNELTVEQKLKTLFQLQTMLSKIDEIKTICHYCSRKATMVLRMEDGKQFMREHKFKLEDTRVISPFAESTGLIHLKKT